METHLKEYGSKCHLKPLTIICIVSGQWHARVDGRPLVHGAGAATEPVRVHPLHGRRHRGQHHRHAHHAQVDTSDVWRLMCNYEHILLQAEVQQQEISLRYLENQPLPPLSIGKYDYYFVPTVIKKIHKIIDPVKTANSHSYTFTLLHSWTLTL